MIKNISIPNGVALSISVVAILLSIYNAILFNVLFTPNALSRMLSPNLGEPHVPTPGENYMVCYNIEGRTQGYMNISYGNVRIRGATTTGNNVSYDIELPACSSVTAVAAKPIELKRSSEFDGVVDVSIHQIKRPVEPVASFPTCDIDGKMEIRVTGTRIMQSYFIGKDAGRNDSYGKANLAFGNEALENVMTGRGNIAIGLRALNALTGSNSNVAVGNMTLKENTIGYNNTAIGSAALETNRSGFDNVGLGIRALALNESGNNNTGLGTDAFEENVSGSNNTGMGTYAGRLNKTSSGNTVGGFAAMYNYTGSLGQNTALGMNALVHLENGGNNTAIGMNTGLSVVDAVNSIWIGLDAGADTRQAKKVVNSISVGANSWTDRDNQISLGDESILEVRTWGSFRFKKRYPADGSIVEPDSLFLGDDGNLYFKTGDGKVVSLLKN